MALARFMLALIHRGRIIHGATYFDDTCQPPWHGFLWARCQDLISTTARHDADRTDKCRTNYI